MSNALLTLSMITREMIHRVRDNLGHGLLYDPRYMQGGAPIGLFEVMAIGLTPTQFHTDWEVNTQKFCLSLDDFSSEILVARAKALSDRLKELRAIVTFDLILPKSGVIESARHVYDGISMRAIVAHNPCTDGQTMCWDILTAACDYEAMRRMAA